MTLRDVFLMLKYLDQDIKHRWSYGDCGHFADLMYHCLDNKPIIYGIIYKNKTEILQHCVVAADNKVFDSLLVYSSLANVVKEYPGSRYPMRLVRLRRIKRGRNIFWHTYKSCSLQDGIYGN